MHRTRPAETHTEGTTDGRDLDGPGKDRPGAEEPGAASRRRFLQLLAAVSAAPWARTVLPGLGLAAAGQAAAQAPEAEEPSAQVRALLDLVKAQWGDRLSAADLQVIEENLGWMQRSSQALRGATLQNSDEPDVIFRAEPPEAS